MCTSPANITSSIIPFQPELFSAVKRTAEIILQKGGVLRKLDNLGFTQLPYKISMDRTPYREANRFIYTFDVPPIELPFLREECKLDVDIIRSVIYLSNENIPYKCTLEEEMQPPAYRKDVKELLKLAKRKEKKYWLPQTGIDYYPFSR